MANIDAMVQEGIAAIKAGRTSDAKAVLMKAVELDEQNEQAWLWLSACVETTSEQQICLENVLAINPSNEKARKGLAAITKKTGQLPPLPDPLPASNNDDDNPFAGTGFDANPYASAANDPILESGWGSFDVGDVSSTDDSYASPLPPAPIDRGNPTAEPPAAYGSGRNVPLPSSDEYDSWVSGLSLGDSSATGSAAFGSGFDDSNFSEPVYSDPGFPDSSDSFASSDFSFATDKESFGSSSPGPFDEPIDDMSNPGPFSSSNYGSDSFDRAPSAPAGKSDPVLDFGSGTPPSSGAFTVNDFDAPYSDSPSEPSPFGGSKSDLFGSSSSSFGSSSFGDDLPAAKAPPSTGSFLFIDPEAPPMMNEHAYFKAIPAEIQADGVFNPPPDSRLILTVGILAALNVLSLAFLLFNVIKH